MKLLSRLLLALLLLATPALASDMGSSNWSQTDASNNATPPNGWPENMAPSTVNDAARAMMGALKRDWAHRGPTVTSAGNDTITLTYSVAPAAYVQGDSYCFVAGGTNTGAATINVNALGAKSIKKGAAGSTALAAGDITSGGVYCLQYDGTNMQLVASTAVTGSTITTPVSVANGGTNASSASGTALDNITGFSSTGHVVRTGSGAYSFRTITAGTGIGVTNGSGVSGNPTIAIDSTVRTTGAETIWIPAGAMTARTTNGCASGTAESATNKVMSKTLDCDASTNEYAQAAVMMPKSWNLGTITVQFAWESGSTGNVVWGAQCVSISDDDLIDTAFGTGVEVTDGVTATTDVMVSAATSAITCAGTPAAGDWTVIQFYRNAASGSDTDTGDAKLLGAKIIYTTNAANDS